MFGLSLSPRVLSGVSLTDTDRKLLSAYGGTDGLLRALRGLGITHVELRAVSPTDDAALVLSCAEKIWNAGLFVTVHGALPETPGAFEEAYPALLPLLDAAKSRQEFVCITLHACSSGTDIAANRQKTADILALWEKDAPRLGFRLALEINRDKGTADPTTDCRGVTDILRTVNSEHIGGCFDFGHFYYNMSRREHTPDLLPDALFLSRSVHTHIHALNPEGKTHHPFTEGNTLPLEEYVSSLVKAGYRGVFNLELEFERFADADFRDAVRDSVLALRTAWHNAAPAAEITRKRLEEAAVRTAPEALRRMREQIFSPSEKFDDSLWTFAASGYIFRTGGALFAVDPAVRAPEMLLSAKEEIRAIFEKIPYIFISHFHDDHFDPKLARLLADLPCRWIIPQPVLPEAMEEAGLKEENILYVRPGDTLTLPGITAEVFPGHHFSRKGTGIDEVMYRFTVGGKTLFLPGDVRDYGTEDFPAVDSPDLLIAHVWLGRAQALCTAQEAVEEYCDFVSYFRPKRVLLGHLMEFSRWITDLWRWEHAGRVMDGLALRLPETEVTPMRIFSRYDL